MFPAIPLALKIGGPILAAGLVVGGWYLYKDSLRDEGREECEQAQDLVEAAQQEKVNEIQRAQYESTIDILKRQMAEKEDFDAKTRKALAVREAQNRKLRHDLAATENQSPEVIHDTQYIEIEVEKPVPYQVPCFVSWGDVDDIDRITRVLNEIPYSRVPDVSEAGQRGDLSGPSPVTCAAFTKRIKELTNRLGHSLINHRTMSEHAWSQYQLQESFQQGLRHDAERAVRPND